MNVILTGQPASQMKYFFPVIILITLACLQISFLNRNYQANIFEIKGFFSVHLYMYSMEVKFTEFKTTKNFHQNTELL